MKRTVLNFGDYILNEKRKEAELFLSNKINESNEFGDLISPIEFIKTRTYEKIDYFFKDKIYKEDLKKLDLNSVIVDIVNWYESGGGESGLTWDSLQKTLLVQESSSAKTLKIAGKIGGLLSRIKNNNIKEAIGNLFKSVATSLKGGKYSVFLTENADDIIKKIAGLNHLKSVEDNAFGLITAKKPNKIFNFVQYVEAEKSSTDATEILANLSKGYDAFFTDLPFIKERKFERELWENSTLLFLPYKRTTPIADVFEHPDKYQVIDVVETFSNRQLPYIMNINGEKKLFLGNIELDVDRSGNFFFMKNSFKNNEGKVIKNIDDYKKSFINYFKKNVDPQTYDELFVSKGAPSFKAFIESTNLVKEKGDDISNYVDKKVGPAVVQTEEQLQVPDKKDYKLVKKIFTMRNISVGVGAAGLYAFWELWARDYWKKFGSETLYFPSQFPKEFIKQTNLRIQGLDSFNNLKNKILIPENVLPDISYYIAQNMQSYYGKIMPTYIAAITIHEASK